MAENREVKNQRISKNQKEKLVEYMATHLEFARGQFDSVNANVKNKGDWLALSTSLNSLGGGNKTVEQWKKSWLDLKAGVKKKINSRRNFFNKTGGGSIKDAPADLNDLDEQILSIMGTHVVDGDSITMEAGVPPLTEPMFSVEILDDEMDEPSTMYTSTPSSTIALPSCKPPTQSSSIQPSTSKQFLRNEKPHVTFKAGMEDAKEMHAELISSMQKMDIRIDANCDRLEAKIDAMLTKLNALLDLHGLNTNTDF